MSGGGGERSRLVVLASGSGSNLEVLMEACDCGEVPATVAGVVSDRPEAFALERARRRGIPAVGISAREVRAAGGSREDFDRRLASTVKAFDPHLVVLAGYMRILSPVFLDGFGERGILNIHPALLPDDPGSDCVPLPDGTVAPVLRGAHAVADALQAGLQWTGTTVHFVTAEVDRGPVVSREAVPIVPGDTVETLTARIQATEHRLYARAIREVLLADAGLARSPSRPHSVG